MVLVAGGAGKIPLALDLEIEQVQQVIEGQNWGKTDSIFYRLFQ